MGVMANPYVEGATLPHNPLEEADNDLSDAYGAYANTNYNFYDQQQVRPQTQMLKNMYLMR